MSTVNILSGVSSDYITNSIADNSKAGKSALMSCIRQRLT